MSTTGSSTFLPAIPRRIFLCTPTSTSNSRSPCHSQTRKLLTGPFHAIARGAGRFLECQTA
jgi:hypothetical protein